LAMAVQINCTVPVGWRIANPLNSPRDLSNLTGRI
jgi:hypothetical protein